MPNKPQLPASLDFPKNQSQNTAYISSKPISPFSYHYKNDPIYHPRKNDPKYTKMVDKAIMNEFLKNESFLKNEGRWMADEKYEINLDTDTLWGAPWTDTPPPPHGQLSSVC